MAWKFCTQYQQNQRYDYSKILLRQLDLGQWPIIAAEWDEDGSGVQDPSTLTALLTRKYAINTLISTTVDTNWKHNSENLLYIDQITLTRQAIYYRTKEIERRTRTQLEQCMFDMAYELARFVAEITSSPITLNYEDVSIGTLGIQLHGN